MVARIDQIYFRDLKASVRVSCLPFSLMAIAKLYTSPTFSNLRGRIFSKFHPVHFIAETTEAKETAFIQLPVLK